MKPLLLASATIVAAAAIPGHVWLDALYLLGALCVIPVLFWFATSKAGEQ